MKILANTTTRLWAAWSITTAFCLLLMLLHQSNTGTFLGRYSGSYALQLGMMAAILLASIIMTVLASREKLPNLRPFLPQKYGLWIILAVGMVGLMALWLFLPGGRGQPAVALFSAYLVLAGGGVLLWLARQTTQILPRWTDMGFIFTTLAITLILSIRYVGHIPASLLYDEPWVTNWSITLWQTGQPHIPMYPLLSPARALMGSSWFVPLGAWLDFAGISLVNARWFWWLLGMMSVPLLAWAANRLYGRTGAVLAAVLGLGLFLPHNYGRWDVAVLLSLAVALYALVSGWQNGRWQWYALAGIATALSLEGHFLSLRWIIAFGAVMLWEYLQVVRQKRPWAFYAPFWAFLIGGIFGSLLFMFLHTLAWGISPLDWWAELNRAYNAEAGLATTYGTGLERIGNMAQAWLIQTLVDYPLETALLALGLFTWAIYGTQTERRLFVLPLLGTLILFLLQPKTSPFYAVHHLAFTVLAGTGLFVKISGALNNQRTLAWGVSALLTIGLTTTHILWLDRNNTQNADQTIALGYELNHYLPAEIQQIAARQPYYYGLAERDFINIELFHVLDWQEWESRLGILPPQAILMTRGWDDPYPAVRDYIKTTNMVKMACFPLDIYGSAADLYVLPEFVPDETVSSDGCGG